MPRSRRLQRPAIGFAAALVLALAAPVALAADQVKITPGNPATTFTGTDKNTGTTAHNFVSIGTAGAGGQENNPVTSFTVNGQSCQLYAAYGSAYCQVNLPPGATITFSGSTQTAATTFSYCTSDNNGIDNDCHDVNVASSAPTGPSGNVLTDLAHLDEELTRTIHSATAGNLTGSQLTGAIGKLEQEKLALIKADVTGKMFGLAAYSVVTQLAVVDYFLGGAVGAAAAGDEHGAIGKLKEARKVKQRLEKGLKDHGSPPSGLMDDLQNLDEDLTRTIHRATGGTLTGSHLTGAIGKLEQEKLALIKANVTGKLFGLQAYSVVTQLAVVDYFLGGALGQSSAGQTAGAIDKLKQARKIKQRLERGIKDHGSA